MRVVCVIPSCSSVPSVVSDAVRQQTWPCDLLISERAPVASHPVDLLRRLEAVAEHREHCRRLFLAGRCDLLWWVDADVVVPPHALQELLSASGRGRDVVAGLYRQAGEDPQPWCAGVVDAGGSSQAIEQAPAGLLQVSWVGLGCTLIRREVLQQVRGVSGEGELTRDVAGQVRVHDDATSFCRAAALEGFCSWLHGAVVCEHRWRSGTGTGLGVDRPAVAGPDRRRRSKVVRGA